MCSQALCLEPENIITSLIINDGEYRDIELVLTEEQMFLPAKHILKMFGIVIEQNHLEKMIGGTTPSGELFVIAKNGIIIADEQVDGKVIFMKDGLTPMVRDEFFVSSDVLSKITESEIIPNIDDLVVNLNSPKFVTISDDGDSSVIASAKKVPKAYEDVKFPEDKGIITLDTIEFQNNVTSDSTSQAYRDRSTNTFMFNNNTRFVLKGKLNSGDYKVEMASNNYTGEAFSFNGLGIQYKNVYDKYNYTLGKVDSWHVGNNISAIDDLIGFSINDDKKYTNNYRDIEGYVDKKSLIKVYINDDFEKVLDTYGGYYSLKNLFYNNKDKKVEKIRVEEVFPDETTKVVLEKNFRQDPDRLLKGEYQHDFVTGYTGLQNRLWSDNGYIYESNTKKFVAGGKYKVGLSDKLNFENFYLTDKIVSMPGSYNWGQSLLANRNYLNFFTAKNPNMLEGQTYMGVFDYKINDRANSRFMTGFSNSMSQDEETVDGRGMALDWEGAYNLSDEKTLKGNLFYYSPDFYLAGSSGGSSSCKSDRLGISARANSNIAKLALNGRASLYNSNLNDFYKGGTIGFNEYEVGASIPFEKFPSMRFRYKTRKGSNKMGEIASDSFDASARKNFRRGASLEGGVRSNNYSNYYADDEYSGYKSKYSNIYTNLSFKLPKKLGSMTLNHEIVETKSDDNKDSYNVARVGYTFPTFKKVSLNVSSGYHYTGLNRGFDFGAGIRYRMKSGSCVSLNYRFNRAPGYLVDSMFLPSTMRHYVTLDFSEVFGFGDNGVHSVGMNNFDKGFVEAVAFLDLNRNGVMDKGEIKIEGVPINFDNVKDFTFTNRKGSTGLKTLQEGIHTVKIQEEELPTFLSPHCKSNSTQMVKVSSHDHTKVYFGLISSIGNISGKVDIKDEYGRKLGFKELIVVVKTEDGEEVGYTTVLEDGTYSMGGLSPGKYTVMVDKDYQKHYKIHPSKKTANKKLKIPVEYKKFVDMKNVDLDYIYSLVPTI